MDAQGSSVSGETNSITVTEAHTASSASVSTTIGYYDLTTSNQLIYEKVLTTAVVRILLGRQTILKFMQNQTEHREVTATMGQ